jgi:hypothetical protein
MNSKRVPMPLGSKEDFDLQAGSRGLSVQDVVGRYMKTPGHVLALLRFSTGEEISVVATATHIPDKTLTAYEKGTAAPSLHHLTLLAAHYKANLRFLLEAFGHVNQDAAPESLGMAAKFGGELTEHEKLDLKSLMNFFTRRR